MQIKIITDNSLLFSSLMGYTILVNFQLMGIWIKRNIACGLFIIFGKISEPQNDLLFYARFHSQLCGWNDMWIQSYLISKPSICPPRRNVKQINLCNRFHRLFYQEDIQDLPRPANMSDICICNVLSVGPRHFPLSTHMCTHRNTCRHSHIKYTFVHILIIILKTNWEKYARGCWSHTFF